MFSRFRHRSNKLEHIDTGDYTSEEYDRSLVELRRVNRWLGDARAMRQSLLAEIERSGLRRFSVLDVGAGSGELLRVGAEWARNKNRRGTFAGVELNARSARAIVERSIAFPEISAIRSDAMNLPFPDSCFDYVICSLMTHHFTDTELVRMLRELKRVVRRQIFVIDLHRHPVAYYLYITVGRLFLHNRLLREDGALSILRAFKANELHRLAQQAGLNNVTVTRKLFYRLVLSSREEPGGVNYVPPRSQEVDEGIRLAS